MSPSEKCKQDSLRFLRLSQVPNRRNLEESREESNLANHRNLEESPGRVRTPRRRARRVPHAGRRRLPRGSDASAFIGWEVMCRLERNGTFFWRYGKVIGISEQTGANALVQFGARICRKSTRILRYANFCLKQGILHLERNLAARILQHLHCSEES